MLYDIMGHNSTDLLILDIFDYFKIVPSKKNEELHVDHEGLDYSAFLEGLHMLEVDWGEGEDAEMEVRNVFMKVAKIKKPEQIEETYLTYPQFKDAWLQICDAALELEKRKLVPQRGTFAAGKILNFSFHLRFSFILALTHSLTHSMHPSAHLQLTYCRKE